MNKSVEDCLIVSVDFSSNDKNYMVVARRNGDETYIVNELTDNEAVEIYTKLIGKECESTEAEWVMVLDDFDDGVGNRELPHCSKCGRGVYRHDAGSYCPFCGAAIQNPMKY